MTSHLSTCGALGTRRASDLRSLARLRQPLIAAINGHALGGGLEIAATADLGSPRATQDSACRRPRSASYPVGLERSACSAGLVRRPSGGGLLDRRVDLCGCREGTRLVDEIVPARQGSGARPGACRPDRVARAGRCRDREDAVQCRRGVRKSRRDRGHCSRPRRLDRGRQGRSRKPFARSGHPISPAAEQPATEAPASSSGHRKRCAVRRRCDCASMPIPSASISMTSRAS